MNHIYWIFQNSKFRGLWQPQSTIFKFSFVNESIFRQLKSLCFSLHEIHNEFTYFVFYLNNQDRNWNESYFMHFVIVFYFNLLNCITVSKMRKLLWINSKNETSENLRLYDLNRISYWPRFSNRIFICIRNIPFPNEK